MLGGRPRQGDELVQRLGMTGVSKSEGSRIGAGLDERVAACRQRRREARYPSVWLDAKSVQVRAGDRVVSMAGVVAIGVRADGEREVLGGDGGLRAAAVVWPAFLRSLVARGLPEGQLVSSDAQEGRRQAMQPVIAERAESGADVGPGAGRGAGPHDRWATGPSHRPEPAHPGGGDGAGPVPPSRGALGDGDGGHAGVHAVAAGALAADRFPDPAGAAHPGDWAPDGRGGIFPPRAAGLRLVGAVLMAQTAAWMVAPRRSFRLDSLATLETPATAPLELPAAL